MPCEVQQIRDESEALVAIGSNRSLIARGAGRSYGDAALNPEMTVLMEGSHRILSFDIVTGQITCQAGLLLGELLAVFVPRGWFPPVTPGTQYVTVGGMVASDVHGKNHHGAGSFGNHVISFDLARADGQVMRCAADKNAELFNATIGGMGLTGVILRVTFEMIRIETDLISQQTIRTQNLAEAFDALESSLASTYSVAWIDSLATGDRLGRSVVFLGEHLKASELPGSRSGMPFARGGRRSHRIPFDFPTAALNRYSVRAFNALYFGSQKPGNMIVDYRPYFYPLDSVSDWNRIYGGAGFVQYQVAFPRETSRDGIRSILRRVSHHGLASFLSVLKLFGQQRNSPLSFPREGYTLALDFPIRPQTFSMLLELDRIVDDHQGRIYLAKDARMGARMLEKGYPRVSEFASLRARNNPHNKFRSLLSDRLGF
jgi:decaprenylphospho-beta-D-ribofuranose 2-oxidase